MTTAVTTTSESNALVWTGRVLSGLVILFLLFDGAIKLIPLDVVIETSRELGIPTSLARTLGILTLLCTLLYAIPLTSVLGAVLMTGYLGGAIYVHVLNGSPLLTHTLFGVYLGIMMWGGLFLRDPQLRQIFPFRR
ncbi:DoxX family protein [Bradyrhizobium sp. U87765 SZCCT0131]|uniref:DoxX family protein n=1 Tax=unclassified Bradyrhizobium TaxID=2631580 RepID=UPI001BAD2249|nr:MULTISPECIES: DoxX family protein [unclassified Bradyrhizobium]MBR1218076.1 DoxX family protein [Bradyrhizobium sp. U87765 SZCCT0131]MBR1260978.1 DoxX family protein [Bradyrhizobium sp. U87765 SZCCT0134]MBR1303574.1 DoxX family protein [Bradyrhizobium sp. U87765 SZCCT0110]MBR1319180.1 DoxX family protein [Bradyrhizobium sp. U87765 SZCCT0109]MBR1347505.1 DoxX family protein [Bradyrhizobium sp. U87765 SZCCT0048]